MDDATHSLIDSIYAASIESPRWAEVSEQLSKWFDGSPVIFGFTMPPTNAGEFRWHVGFELGDETEYLRYFLESAPWSARMMQHITGRFESVGRHIDERVEDTPVYLEWMKPRGLAPIWPVGIAISNPRGVMIGGAAVFRSAGESPFTSQKIAEAQTIATHLTRAMNIQMAIESSRQVSGALSEAIDLLPTGLILLDPTRSIVLKNRGADRILRLADGVQADSAGPSLGDARQNAELQVLIADAIESGQGGGEVSTGFMAVKRPSGKKSFALMVSPLLGRGVLPSGAVAAIFIADPEAGRINDPDVLSALYDLTHSEAELVRLLSEGMSLEDAAHQRGVSMNTVRSHLKRAFAKTGTSRQGELVRLILSGAGSIGEE